ncbi:MAG: hypothetical protein SGILL_009503 [Bacillariaceae sp.]
MGRNVQVELLDRNTSEIQKYTDGSGAIADYKCLGLVNEETYLETFHQVDTVVTTCSSTATLFRFPKEIMRELASTPALRNVWQTIFISQMARLVIMLGGKAIHGNYGLASPFVRSSEITPDHVASLFLPLKDDELPPSTISGSSRNMKSLKNAVKHICRYAITGFYLPWPIHGHPIGIRHELTPPQSKWIGDQTDAIAEEPVDDDSSEEVSVATDDTIVPRCREDVEAPASKI